MKALEGALPVDKAPGPTSHDLVALARRVLGIRRVGHTGTLDPFASGLLMLLLGRATRLAEYFAPLEKEYEATLKLGTQTSTDDTEGEVLRTDESWQGLAEERVESALLDFRGDVAQVPPVFSAKKIGGESAHRRARRGEKVTLRPRRVRIHDVALLGIELPLVRFRVTCSSGTYIRALARDLGEAVGSCAHLVELRRVRIGPFTVSTALDSGDLRDRRGVAERVIPPSRALPHLPALTVGPEQAQRLATGQAISLEASALPEESPIRVLVGDDLVAIGIRKGGLLHPRKVLSHG